LEWAFNDFYFGDIFHLSTPHTYVFELEYAYSGTLYWILLADHYRPEADAQYPTTEQLKAGLKADGHKAPKSGNLAFRARPDLLAYETFVVDGLKPDSMYTVYYFAEIKDAPTLNFQAYVLTGEIGDNSTHQLYRTVPEDSINLALYPASNPMPTRVQMMQPMKTPKSVAYTDGPAMFLIALCLCLSLSQMFL
jgi:hypothetical protein